MLTVLLSLLMSLWPAPDSLAQDTAEPDALTILQQVWDTPHDLIQSVEEYEAVTTTGLRLHCNWRDTSTEQQQEMRRVLQEAGTEDLYSIACKQPGLMIQIEQAIRLNNGRLMRKSLRTLNHSTDLSAPQVQRLQHDLLIDRNAYASLYASDTPWSPLYASLYNFRCTGTYTDNGRIVYILECPDCQLHIVSDIWQIKQISMQSLTGRVSIACQEILPGLYLPVEGHNERNLVGKSGKSLRPYILRNYTIRYPVLTARAEGSVPALSPLTETVYLHTDADAYCEGDTLWFKAYVAEAGTGRYDSEMSRVLYVDLFNSNDNLIYHKLLEVDSLGQARGCLPLGLPLRSGFYRLCAYTRTMLGRSERECYSQVVPLLGIEHHGDHTGQLGIRQPELDYTPQTVQDTLPILPYRPGALQVRVSQNQPTYSPYQPVTLDIEVTDSTGCPVPNLTLSLSVQDALTQLSADRSVPFATCLSPLRPDTLTTAPREPEQILSLQGRVTKDHGAPRQNTQLKLQMYSAEGDTRTAITLTDDDGNFRLEASEPYYGTYLAQFTVRDPDTSNRKGRHWSNISLDRNFGPRAQRFSPEDLTVTIPEPLPSPESTDSLDWLGQLVESKDHVLREALIKDHKRYRGFKGTRYTYGGGIEAGQRRADIYLDVIQELQRRKDKGNRDLTIWDLLTESPLKVDVHFLAQMQFNQQGFETWDEDELISCNLPHGRERLPYSIFVDGHETVVFLNNKLVCVAQPTANYKDSFHILDLDCSSHPLTYDMMAEEFCGALVIKDPQEWQRLASTMLDPDDWFMLPSRNMYALFLYETPDMYRLRSRMKGVDKRVIQGFERPRDYSTTIYNAYNIPESPDLRRTLYWNPTLKTDANGHATVQFSNNARPHARLTISLRGLAPDGQVVDYRQR